MSDPEEEEDHEQQPETDVADDSAFEAIVAERLERNGGMYTRIIQGGE